MPINIDSDAVRRLADIGFLGVSRKRFEDAEEIFAALATVRPDSEVGPIGLAVARLGRGAYNEARDALRAGPQTDAVLAFTCIALARAGDRDAARDICEELGERAPGDPLTELARAAIEGSDGAARAGGMA